MVSGASPGGPLTRSRLRRRLLPSANAGGPDSDEDRARPGSGAVRPGAPARSRRESVGEGRWNRVSPVRRSGAVVTFGGNTGQIAPFLDLDRLSVAAAQPGGVAWRCSPSEDVMVIQRVRFARCDPGRRFHRARGGAVRARQHYRRRAGHDQGRGPRRRGQGRQHRHQRDDHRVLVRLRHLQRRQPAAGHLSHRGLAAGSSRHRSKASGSPPGRPRAST